MRLTLLALALVTSCAAGPARAIEPALGQDACGHCRMTIVSRATAAQIVRPGDEPVFFDDLACLRDFLLDGAIPGDAVSFVADHGSGEWIEARHAIFTETSTATPMASGLLAHANQAGRDGDPAAASGRAVAADAILGPRPQPVTP